MTTEVGVVCGVMTSHEEQQTKLRNELYDKYKVYNLV